MYYKNTMKKNQTEPWITIIIIIFLVGIACLSIFLGVTITKLTSVENILAAILALKIFANLISFIGSIAKKIIIISK